ncbi:WAT1-related protein [Drosera capensis]
MNWLEMSESSKKDLVEEIAIIAGLIAGQVFYAGNAVMSSYLMSLGLNPLTLIVLCSSATFLVLSPISFLFERHQWPKKLTKKLMVQLVLIAFTGHGPDWDFKLLLMLLHFSEFWAPMVTLFQSLILQGLKMTSPAIATAMPNLAPGFIFAIAWAFRLEKVKVSCLYSRVKIGGTLLCVVGAVTMSILQSTTVQPAEEAPLSSLALDGAFDREKIIGCLYLVAGVFVLSSNIVLQAHTLGDFPAPISLCAITSLIGVIITGLIELGQYHKFDIDWSGLGVGSVIGFSLLAGAVIGTSVSFNGWAMKKRGPVLVSMFSPISTVLSLVLGVVSLGDTIRIGSLAGMLLMFTGLYCVLWAKGKEGYPPMEEVVSETEDDTEKPLLV